MSEGQIDVSWYQSFLERIPDSETPGLLFSRAVGEMLEIDDERCVWIIDWERCLTQQEIDDACVRIDALLQ